MSGKRSHEVAEDPEAKRRLVGEWRDLPETPYGIPGEMLKEILSYITGPRDNSRVERVNKTFRDLAWVGFQGLNIRHDDVREEMREEAERFREWFPTMWRKAVNLRHADICKLDFLAGSVVLDCQNASPRRIESIDMDLYDDDDFDVINPEFPTLLHAWKGSLKEFRLKVIDTSELGNEDREFFEAIGRALDGCSQLKHVALEYKHNSDFGHGILESLGDKKNLQSLEFQHGSSMTVEKVAECLISLQANQHPQGFCMKFEFWDDMLEVFEFVVRSNVQLHFITRIEVISSFQVALGEEPWPSIFWCLPNLKYLRLSHRYIFGSYTHKEDTPDDLAIKIVIAFLGCCSDCPKKKQVEIFHSRTPLYGRGTIEERVQEAIKKVEAATGIEGELLTDHWQVNTGLDSVGGVPYEGEHKLKFVKGAAECCIFYPYASDKW